MREKERKCAGRGACVLPLQLLHHPHIPSLLLSTLLCARTHGLLLLDHVVENRKNISVDEIVVHNVNQKVSVSHTVNHTA